MVLGQSKDGSWVTLFKADSYVSNGGQKISSEELKKILYAPEMALLRDGRCWQ
jgi:hypothetical protein